MLPTNHRGEPVPEIEICNQVLAAGSKEALSAKPALELVQCAGSLMNLERRHHRFGSVLGAEIWLVPRTTLIRTTVSTSASV